MSFQPDVPRYAAVPHARAPLSAQEFLLVTRTGERHVMTAEVLDALARMSHFATLAEHRQRLIAANPELAKAGDQVMRVLESLVQRGLLKSEHERLSELFDQRDAPSTALKVVLMLTGRDATPLLRALATELVDSPVVLSEVLVLAPAGLTVDAAALQAAAAPLPLRVVGAEQVRQWLHDLGEHCLPGAGPLTATLAEAPANLAQLLGSGQRVLWLDDRQHLPLRVAPDAVGSFALDESTARSVSLHADHAQALAAGQSQAGGLRRLIELCGRSFSGLGAQLDGGVLGLRSLSELDVIEAGSTVRSVVCGTTGCAEGEHSLWMYMLDPRSREQLCSTRAAYDRGIEAEALSHSVREARLMRGGAYRPLLLDASGVSGLVPAATVHSERVLHALGSFVAPHSLVAMVPEMLGYSVRLPRSRSDANASVPAPSLNGFVADQALLRRDELVGRDPARRLMTLALQLRDLAQADSRQHRALLWEYLSYQQSQTIAALQASIEAAGTSAPDYWRQDIARIVNNYGQGLLQAKVARLAETPDSYDQQQAGEHFGHLLEAAAAKIELWPDLLTAARERPL